MYPFPLPPPSCFGVAYFSLEIGPPPPSPKYSFFIAFCGTSLDRHAFRPGPCRSFPPLTEHPWKHTLAQPEPLFLFPPMINPILSFASARPLAAYFNPCIFPVPHSYSIITQKLHQVPLPPQAPRYFSEPYMFFLPLIDRRRFVFPKQSDLPVPLLTALEAGAVIFLFFDRRVLPPLAFCNVFVSPWSLLSPRGLCLSFDSFFPG